MLSKFDQGLVMSACGVVLPAGDFKVNFVIVSVITCGSGWHCFSCDNCRSNKRSRVYCRCQNRQ